jgi:uncharacterized protein
VHSIGTWDMPQSLTCRPLFNSVLSMIRKILILISLYLCQSAFAHAAVVPGLYEAEVPVTDQSAESHKNGLSRALLEVLIKLTGDRQVQGRPVTAELLRSPELYVQQYRYQNKAVIEDGQLSLQQQLMLSVSFNEATLDKALRDYAVPVWGRVRPSTLVWLVVQDGQRRQFVGLEDAAGFTAKMSAQAQSRGITLRYPLLDSEDTNVLKEADVWGGFIGPIKQASARYGADVILTGSIENTATGWLGYWASIIHDEVSTWTTTGEEPALVLHEGVDSLVDTLANRYIQTTPGVQEAGIEIVVKDVSDFEQYSKVLQYLRTLNSVTAVDVKTVEPGSVTFSLTATGSEIVVQRAIELGRILESLTGGGSPYRLLQ